MKFMKVFLAALLAVVVGSLISMVFWLMSIFGLAGSLGKASEPVLLLPESMLVIDFGENLVDSPNADAMASFNPQTFENVGNLHLLKALQAIERATEDDNIKGIYLRMNGAGGVMGSALLEELRQAISDFKQSGKFVVAYNEMYTQGSYYLASVANQIYLQPQGGFEWVGMSSDVMFYKGLMDKLGVEMQILRPTVCRYKSAVEPFFLEKMSDENREQMQTLLNSMWKTLSEEVAESRNIEMEKLQKLADELAVMLPEEAEKEGLIDALLYEDEVETKLNEEWGIQKDEEGKLHQITLGQYAALMEQDMLKTSQNEIAVVYADGEIVDGEGAGAQIFGNSMAEKIRQVRLDEAVKGVVLRVNSPGGSALAADLIWREIELLKKEKPVIVSMGSYAASGGYYISAPSDVILSDKMTLTGSIGVFGMIPNVEKGLKNKLGVNVDGVSTNRESSFSLFRPMTKVQRKSVMKSVDKVYETFTGLVAEGRNLPLERVLEIAGGRVWSGVNAKEIGLVDSWGGLKKAIALTADRAGVSEDFSIREVVDEPEGLAALLAMFKVKAQEIGVGLGLVQPLSPEEQILQREYLKLKEAISMQGVVSWCPYQVSLEL